MVVIAAPSPKFASAALAKRAERSEVPLLKKPTEKVAPNLSQFNRYKSKGDTANPKQPSGGDSSSRDPPQPKFRTPGKADVIWTGVEQA